MNDFDLVPIHGIAFFGGGPKEPAKPDAPVTGSAVEVVDAARQRRRDLSGRKGFLSTLVAGNPDSQNGGKQLLGGGQ